MAKLIKELQNNRSVIFDTGSFDNFCVYVVESDGTKKAPYDKTYFSELFIISNKYNKDKVYYDFVDIYEKTTGSIDSSVLNQIDKIVGTYNKDDKIIIEQWFTVIYGGMIAEENKKRAILKKRIKRLGIHQVLILNMPASEAAKFSYGKKWRDLDVIMRKLGF